MWSINPLTDLVSPAAWVRQVSITLFGHDPFDAWTRRSSGDWAAYVHCGAALSRVGDGAYDIGRNLLAGAQPRPGTCGRATRPTPSGTSRSASATRPARCATPARRCGPLRPGRRRREQPARRGRRPDRRPARRPDHGEPRVGRRHRPDRDRDRGARRVRGGRVLRGAQAYQLYQEIARCYSVAEDLIEALGATIGLGPGRPRRAGPVAGPARTGTRHERQRPAGSRRAAAPGRDPGTGRPLGSLARSVLSGQSSLREAVTWSWHGEAMAEPSPRPSATATG